MKTWIAAVSLVGVTAVWGWTFVVVKNAIAVDGVVPFLAARFLLAALIVVALWGRKLTASALRAGALLGLVLAAGYLFQTWGLGLTTATNSGLITGLFVIAAPLADRLLYRTRLSRVNIAATVLSLVGMALLTGWSPDRLATGDLLTLLGAVAFGVHIALLSHYSPRHDSSGLTAAQLVWVSVIFLFAWPVAKRPAIPPRAVWGALLITGILASALAYFIQTAAQRHLSTA
ncbi:MAG: DMT family transporter, partial [Acidobacteria bacterium]|nr:DMT family transporter [Acidobacteriota bacterium]